MELANQNDLSIQEKDLSLTEFYNADEVFATGTMGELTPVVEIDGRRIENKSNSSVRKKLMDIFDEVRSQYCEEF